MKKLLLLVLLVSTFVASAQLQTFQKLYTSTLVSPFKATSGYTICPSHDGNYIIATSTLVGTSMWDARGKDGLVKINNNGDVLQQVTMDMNINLTSRITPTNDNGYLVIGSDHSDGTITKLNSNLEVR